MTDREGSNDERLSRSLAWTSLRRHTPARVALGRAGASVPTAEALAFTMSHAKARDAVHLAFDAAALASAFEQQGFQTMPVKSQAVDRAEYLRRPDLGRLLREEDRARIALTEPTPSDAHRLTIVIADGLSALAPMRHAVPLVTALRRRLERGGTEPAWQLDTIILASQARVALGDAIGEVRHAEAVAIALGERPGLSSPDSLGIYLTYAPRQSRSDAERNCISNIRAQGVSYDEAAHTLEFLLSQSRIAGASGINIKDTTEWRPDLLD